MSSAPLRRIFAALVLLGGLGGCAGSREPQPETLDEETGKVGVPTPITDLGWLNAECPLLSDATAVVYYGGYYDQVDSRLSVPGPHDYWRDLVVTLPDGRVEGLVGEYGLEGTEERPDVISLLKAEIPEGVLLRSNEFDDTVCASWHWVQAWASVENDQVVLTVYDP